jgi:hypothetical protein
MHVHENQMTYPAHPIQLAGSGRISQKLTLLDGGGRVVQFDVEPPFQRAGRAYPLFRREYRMNEGK